MSEQLILHGVSNMQKRKFYIMGHNPNTLQEASDFIMAGANTLEPDICYDETKPDKFFVSHGGFNSNKFILENSLVTYLTNLRKLITDPQNNLNLALIAFDTKTPTFDINEFIKLKSRLMASPLTFDYGQDEWLIFGQPVTKRPG
jgi:hypothetical protein